MKLLCLFLLEASQSHISSLSEIHTLKHERPCFPIGTQTEDHLGLSESPNTTSRRFNPGITWRESELESWEGALADWRQQDRPQRSRSAGKQELSRRPRSLTAQERLHTSRLFSFWKFSTLKPIVLEEQCWERPWSDLRRPRLSLYFVVNNSSHVASWLR